MTSTMRDRFAEEIAWWRYSATRDVSGLIHVAVLALDEDVDVDAVAELAGMRSDANPFEVDALLDRLVEEFRLDAVLAGPLDLIASRSLCRRLLARDIGSRALTSWAHQNGGHDSESEELQRLAALDDELDLAGARSENAAGVDREVAAVATSILAAQI